MVKPVFCTTNCDNFANEFNEVLKAFQTDLTVSSNATDTINVHIEVSNNTATVAISSSEVFGLKETHIMRFYEGFSAESISDVYLDVTAKRELKHFAKRKIYDAVSRALDVSLPYGSLTGIRPTKLFYDIEKNGENPESVLLNDYMVSPRKVELIRSVIEGQAEIYATQRHKVDLFINIPICPTRCAYCSFISIERNKLRGGIVEAYIDRLVLELEKFKTQYTGRKIRSIYIGGGTPTVLTEDELSRLLVAIKGTKFFNDTEFTVEAGRPDTITSAKLDIMREYGVTRLSINPQSFNQRTLDAVGRAHSVEDIYRVYELAASRGFDINMDLIAMLPNEGLDDFCHSVNCAIELLPANITVHSLALKRGSSLFAADYDFRSGFVVASTMVDYAADRLGEYGYHPYYLYRLKQMSGGLENTGYARTGKACVYNIDIMEETHSIYAIGAGAISKRILPNGKLVRFADSKDIHYYLTNFDEILEKKVDFFSN